MSKACALCGRDPAEGFATIDDGEGPHRYCHGTERRPSCYEIGVNPLRADELVARLLGRLAAGVT